MYKLYKKYRYDLLAVIFLSLTLPLFFYKLGASSLGNWDEAWYADIARNILKNRSLYDVTWNGGPFYDHPPAGFWFTALSYLILGVSDFSARVPQAIAGFLTLVIVYLLGKKLFNRYVGLAAAIGTVSSNWFLYRARSGNLDISLTLLFILSLYLTFKFVENRRFAIPLGLSMSLLFLTKSVVPFSILPAIFIILVAQKKVRFKDLILVFTVFTLFVGSWALFHIENHPGFLKHYFKIGLPGVENKSSIGDNLKLTKEYLHNGIGKWFWPGLAGVVLGLVSFKRSKLALSTFFFTFMFPFILSNKGHIWHMIPVHPIMILSFFAVAYSMIVIFVRKPRLVGISLIILSLYISFGQIKRNWYEFIDTPAFISDEAILSRQAGKFDHEFFIDGDFIPTAVFYSEKNAKQVSLAEIRGLFSTKDQFSLITKVVNLNETNILPEEYIIVKEDRDRVLVIKNNE